MVRRGKLKIYFGYSSGVGKTYTMLQDAHRQLRKGIDVVVGYINPDSSAETLELTNGMEMIPIKLIASSKGMLTEFDLEAALVRKPQILLVDEMAHTNTTGSKYENRFQEIEELLAAGIDVFTTVNAGQIESLNQTVAETFHVPYEDKIPDFFFDCAERVEFIDLEPEELIRRYREGKISRNETRGTPNKGMLKINNLDHLRELSLNRTKERMRKVCNWGF